jgi:hypothetical protein
MRAISPIRRSQQAGSALLMVVFLAAAMLITMSMVLPRLVMQGRRQREEELAWRGEQYVRAVRLYYRKFGRFPRSVEDFSKNPGNLHFLRKEYKDPMNDKDGSWRYIYVGPGGQLIGSLTRKMPLGIVPLQGVAGAATNPQNPLGTQPAPGRPGLGQTTTGPGGAQNVPEQPPQQPPSPSQTAPADATALGATGAPADQSGDAANLPPAPQAPKQSDPNASIGEGAVFGGQLVGVASKIDRKSIRFYKGYGKYREWEFIWDPAEEAAAAGQIPAAVGGQLPVGTQPIGAQPIGTQPIGTQPITTPPQPNNPPQ